MRKFLGKICGDLSQKLPPGVVVMILSGILFIISGIVFAWTNAIPQEQKHRWWWLPFVCEGIGLLILILILPVWLFIKKRKGIQVIAWNGFNEREVKSHYKKSRLDVLEYVRGVEKVTHLKYEGSLFDVLIADVEFLKRHDIGRKLLELKGNNYDSLWDRIPLSLSTVAKNKGNCSRNTCPMRAKCNYHKQGISKERLGKGKYKLLL